MEALKVVTIGSVRVVKSGADLLMALSVMVVMQAAATLPQAMQIAGALCVAMMATGILIAIAKWLAAHWLSRFLTDLRVGISECTIARVSEDPRILTVWSRSDLRQLHILYSADNEIESICVDGTWMRVRFNNFTEYNLMQICVLVKLLTQK